MSRLLEATNVLGGGDGSGVETSFVELSGATNGRRAIIAARSER